jgi:hypothetical protein
LIDFHFLAICDAFSPGDLAVLAIARRFVFGRPFAGFTWSALRIIRSNSSPLIQRSSGKAIRHPLRRCHRYTSFRCPISKITMMDQLENLMVAAFELLGKPTAQAQELARSIIKAAERPQPGHPNPLGPDLSRRPAQSLIRPYAP